jgi:hypothetical protein
MGFFIQTNMKEEILNFFRTDRSYAGAVKLVLMFSPKLGLKKQLNLQEETEYLKGCAFEELRELSGIKEVEMRSILSAPKPKSEPIRLIHPVNDKEETVEVTTFDEDEEGNESQPKQAEYAEKAIKTQPAGSRKKPAKPAKPAKLGKPRSRKK